MNEKKICMCACRPNDLQLWLRVFSRPFGQTLKRREKKSFTRLKRRRRKKCERKKNEEEEKKRMWKEIQRIFIIRIEIFLWIIGCKFAREIRRKQKTKWARIILDNCRNQKKHVLHIHLLLIILMMRHEILIKRYVYNCFMNRLQQSSEWIITHLFLVFFSAHS